MGGARDGGNPLVIVSFHLNWWFGNIGNKTCPYESLRRVAVDLEEKYLVLGTVVMSSLISHLLEPYIMSKEIEQKPRNRENNPIHSSYPLELILELLNFLQTYRCRDPPKADQRAHLLSYSNRSASDVQTCNRSFQRLKTVVILLSLRDLRHGIRHVALMFIFHGHRDISLAFALPAIFAEDAATEDFDFGDVVRVVSRVADHSVGEVFLVTNGIANFSSLVQRTISKQTRRADDLPILDVLCKRHVVVPLDQSRRSLNIFPDQVDRILVRPQTAPRGT